MRRRPLAEWPTLALVLACYMVWALGTTWIAGVSVALGVAVTALATAFFASLQHEAIHGHPFRDARLNAALVFPALTLTVPYGRFRDTHLAHHRDAILTDPYDDPETNYLDPAVWARLPGWLRGALAVNNTLAGRMLLGPLIGNIAFAICEVRSARAGDGRVARGWLWHVPALLPVAAWLWGVGEMPVWAYVLAAYAAQGILRIRTFLEHQAHERARGRTVIIEDRGPLSWLFLNNNLHVVHHMHPKVPWYRLPTLYFADPARYRARNDGYVYRSYPEIFARYFWRAKDPVPHPLWRRP